MLAMALLPEPETVPSCLDCALAAAEGFDVTIAAVQVGFDPRFAFVPPEELALQQLRARNEGALADRLAHTRAAIDSWRSGRGEVPVTFRDDRGDVTAVVAAETALAAGKTTGVGRIVFSPLVRFIKFYVVRQGFRDGLPGLIHIAIGCFNSFLKYSKMLERQRNDASLR